MKPALHFSPNILLITAGALAILFYLLIAFTTEIQPWDEAIYAVRAKGAVNYNAWVDQTRFSPGGLYSAAHPPLAIWLSALSMKTFGINTFAIRIIPLFFSFLTCFIVLKIFGKNLYGYFAFLSLISIPLFFHYSILNQLDMPLTCFMTLSFCCFYKYETGKNISFLVCAGAAFGLALMSKAAYGLIVPFSTLIYLIWRVIQKKKTTRQALKEIFIFSIIGALISFPWLMYMYSKYGKEFINYYVLFHVIGRMASGVEGNEKKLGVLFYINQLIVFFPIIPLAFYALRSDIKTEKAIFYISPLIILIIISLSKTKLPTYIIPALPLFAIAAAFGIKKTGETKTVSAYIYMPVFLLFIWSLSQGARDGIKAGNTAMLFSTGAASLWLGAIIIIASLILFRAKFTEKVFVLVLSLLLTLKILLFPPPFFRTNIEQAGNYFKINNTPGLIFFEPRTNSMISNPQVSYFFDGIDMGLKPDKQYCYYNDIKNIDYKQLSLKKDFMIICSKYTDKNMAGAFENNISGFADKKGSSSEWDFYVVK
jgi:4-amino-4-deoxy-L-arabinose transferase-like glycosyltransferase